MWWPSQQAADHTPAWEHTSLAESDSTRESNESFVAFSEGSSLQVNSELANVR